MKNKKILNTPLDWKNLEFMYEILYKTDGDIGMILSNWPDGMEIENFIDDYKEMLGKCGIYNIWKF